MKYLYNTNIIRNAYKVYKSKTTKLLLLEYYYKRMSNNQKSKIWPTYLTKAQVLERIKSWRETPPQPDSQHEEEEGGKAKWRI